MEVKKVFGIFFTILGTLAILFGGFALMSGGSNLFGTHVSTIGSLVPLIIGIIFFGYGMKLVNKF